MKHSQNSTFTAPANSIIGRLISNIGYYNGKMYRFQKSSSGIALVEPSNSFKPNILIVSPMYFTESIELLPNVEASELRKLIKLKLDSTDIAIIKKKTEQEVKANIWHFLESAPSALVTLPETLLLSTLLGDNETALYTGPDNKERYVISIDNCVASAAKTNLINSYTNFTTSIGTYSGNCIQIEKDEFADKLIAGLIKSNKLDIISFVAKPTKEIVLSLLKRVSIPVFTIGAFYLLASSSYLYLKNEYIAMKTNSVQQEAKTIMGIQSASERKLANYNVLLDLYNSNENPSDTWEVLSPIFALAKINSVALQNNIVKVRGQSKSASDVLQIIADHNGVKNAKFDSPVRKSKGTESFNISFELSSKKISNNEGRVL